MNSAEEPSRGNNRPDEAAAERRQRPRRAEDGQHIRIGPHGSRLPELSRKKKLVFACFVWLIAVLTLYAGSVLYRSYRLYTRLKTNQRGWAVQIFEPDDELGFRPIPNTDSAELFPIGDPVPTRLDQHGFRVPLRTSYAPVNHGPLIMALGCSFTFGAACPAEQTFPYLLGEHLDGRTINAGVCSYGLTQMILRGRRIIPQFHPDIVIVQYSPWLVDRAVSTYAPTYFGRQPVPYFAAGSSGQLSVEPPVFAPSVIDPRAYRDSPSSLSDYTSFLAQSAVPLLLHDDALVSATWLKQRLGIVPPPTEDRQAVVDQVYGELDRLCQDVDAEMIIVILDEQVPPAPRESLAAARHATIVDAHAALVARLPVRDQLTFQRFYAQWRGSPPVLVDHHPNATAHEIIADEIMQAIRRNNAE